MKTQVHSYHVYQRNIRQMYHMRESNYNSNKESNLLEMETLGITMPSDQDFQFILARMIKIKINIRLITFQQPDQYNF